MHKISLGYNAVPANAEKAILDVFRSGQYSPGPKVREFEEKFAKLHKAKHAIFVNSGTDALRLGLLALKEKYHWQDGDLVAVPALTFVATVNVVLQAGLKPLFVDVGMNDYLMNPWNLEHQFETGHIENLRAVMPVHLFGQSAHPKIFELAKEHNWHVLEDSCETIMNPIQGDISCYSTYMAHHVTTGVGGLALSNDFELTWLMRSYANHGRDPLYIPGEHRLIQAQGKGLLKCRFQFPRIGYSNRATEFQAALGLAQLDNLQANMRKRRAICEELKEALSFSDELRFVSFKENTCMMFPIVLREYSAIDKYDLCWHLEKQGIETRDMMPITNQSCYKDLVKEQDFSVAKWINKNGFYIPCHPGMNPKDIEQIRKAFHEFFRNRMGTTQAKPKAPMAVLS